MKKKEGPSGDHFGISISDRLKIYSLTAGAVLAIPHLALGTVRYVNPTDINVKAPSGSFTMDIDGNGASDFVFTAYSGDGAWLAINPATVGASAIVSYSSYTSYYPLKLASGYSIRPSLNTAAAWGTSHGTLNNAFVSRGNFNGATGFLGVKFRISGNTHYGWIKYEGVGFQTEGNIKEWAYEDSPNTPILAGDKGTDDPVANAGTNTVADAGQMVILDGSGSSDPNDPNHPDYPGLTTFSYSWTQTGGTAVSLSGAATATPSFTAPTISGSSETLTFQLTVTDVTGRSNSDSVNVTISGTTFSGNFPPGITASNYRIGAWPVFPGGAASSGATAFGPSIGGYDITLMRIGHWDSTTQSYTEYPNLGSIEPGWAGWFLFRYGSNLSLSGTKVTAVTGPQGGSSYPYDLNQGWNMVGNPFPFPISVSQIIVEDGSWYYLTDPGNTITQRIFWIFQNGAYVPATVLPANSGGWIKKLSGAGKIWFPNASADAADFDLAQPDVGDADQPPPPPGGMGSSSGWSSSGGGGGGGGGGCFINSTD